MFAPTVEEIVRDRLTQLSLQYWAGAPDQLPFDPKVVEDIYTEELSAPNPFSRIMLLELAHYLEAFLWPNFDADKSSVAHVVSILVMVNEKFRENVSAPWACFQEDEARFGRFFQRVLGLREERQLSTREEAVYLLFLINSFQSLENPMVRSECLKLVYLPLWLSVAEGRAEQEVRSLPPRIQERWKKLKAASKKKTKKNAKKSSANDPARTFIPGLLRHFLDLLDLLETPPADNADEAAQEERSARVAYCERFVEWLIDLESQLPTRRFFHLVLQDAHVVERCRLSAFAKRPEASLFQQLVDMLAAFAAFDVNNYSGEALSDEQATAFHCRRIHALQKAAFKLFPDELRALAMSNIGAVQARPSLARHLAALSPAQLRQLAEHFHLLHPAANTDAGAETDTESTEFLLEVLLTHHELRPSQLDKVNQLALYPNEEILWDENAVPAATYTGEHCLALPKLNLQFLTFYDYLLRNFNLFRLEATYAIRADVEDAVRRMNPRRTPSGQTAFNGWARMSLPIKNFRITAVRPPRIGEKQPAAVEAEVMWNLADTQGPMRHEWEELREHDILYLLVVKSPLAPGEQPAADAPFRDQYGVTYCRGAEVAFVLDERGEKVGPPPGSRVTPPGHGTRRRARVLLDPAQYQIDVERGIVDQVYGDVNIVLRRKPKENNFKAILHTIRDLMNSPAAVPGWLHDVFLGYGDPAAARGAQARGWIDFRDTFLDYDHLRHSFPGLRLAPTTDDEAALRPPFQLRFPEADGSSSSSEGGAEPGTVEVRPYTQKNRGPYPYDQPKRNAIPFTPKQVTAIRSAMNEGLTMVVGPPGTGKTDVAVQVISNWYHNYPDQRILLITHSNQALNQLFEKIMALDIDERHLLRLGHGQKLLETEKDFGKYGRVEWMLQKRLRNLELVQKLARAIGAEGDFGWSCESAAHLYSLHVRPAWDNYKARLAAADPADPAAVAAHFPFARFFDDLPDHVPGQPLFAGVSRADDEETARGCFRHIRALFTHLDECRPLELLRTGHDRADFLLIKQARIVAMTCTHAALKRADLVRLGFSYDSVLMEEAAQVLEVETFIPLVLQADSARLKRVVLIGDHNQLPPIIRNMAFQRYAHMDQSLFARFVRLGVPTVMLDAQGRARPSLARLFNWRYAGLQDLPQVSARPEFRAANAGLRYDYQLIDVGDFHGRGEYEPSPYFYQNLGEAEFVCATYQYMRLLGYPAHSISVITSYNGQKNLLRDVFRRRCASHPMFGLPHKISTLDRFQGQQNDYVLLSMVRTKAVGHIRDVRRLIVGMSRARLGFYVFCRKALFENCYELTPAFAHLVRRPSRLHLVPNEIHPQTARLVDQDDESVQSFVVDNVEHMQALVASHAARIQAALVGAPLVAGPDAAVAAAVEAEVEAEGAAEGAAVKKRKLDDGGDNDDQQEEEDDEQENKAEAEEDPQSKKRKTAAEDEEASD